MLTTDPYDHDDRDHHDDDDEQVPVHHATTGDCPALLAAFRAAVHAAQIATTALHAHGIGPDHVTVAATLTNAGQSLVLITATPPGNRNDSSHDREPLRDLIDVTNAAGIPAWLRQRTNAGGGGPPHPARRDGPGTGRAA